jgi:hypothetical protein
MSNEITRFEVRKGITNHARQNAMLQAGYDTMDRMANLFGEISFGDLMTQPFKTLIPAILARIDVVAGYGLIDRPDEVALELNRILTAHAEDSFQTLAEYMATEDAKLSRDYYSPTWRLWFYHGIRLPEFGRDPMRNEKTRDAISLLVQEASDLTYINYQNLPRSKDLKGVIAAVRNAEKNFIIYLPPQNGLCCNCSDGTCRCYAGMSTDYCSVTGQTSCGSSTLCGAGDVRFP